MQDFIESLPLGFNEPVQERGKLPFQTGQKQLINFARALACNPHILILDEATSSVDTDTELRIRGALERMVEGRTSVLIAHRLSTVQRAETILVMHKGQLREMGSHQDLLASAAFTGSSISSSTKIKNSASPHPPSTSPPQLPQTDFQPSSIGVGLQRVETCVDRRDSPTCQLAIPAKRG